MHIVIIEDDVIFASKISQKLERNMYTTKVYNDAKTFYKTNGKFDTDLYIVDIKLLDDTWFNVIKHIRNVNKEYTPIIIMSWFNDTENKVYWLDIWADDYISKPVPPDELLARIRSLIRRHNKIEATNEIKDKDLVYNLTTKKVLLKWEDIRLPKKENQILEFFLQNKWKLVSKEMLIKKIWWIWDLALISDNTINATMSKLRKKLWDNFELRTIIGKWYMLEKWKNKTKKHQ